MSLTGVPVVMTTGWNRIMGVVADGGELVVGCAYVSARVDSSGWTLTACRVGAEDGDQARVSDASFAAMWLLSRIALIELGSRS